MPGLARPVVFRPSSAVLRAIVARLDALGTDGGGAVDTERRRAAFAAYAAAAAPPLRRAARWRHDDARISFEDLVWTSGRIGVPAGRAAGLAHAGAALLDPGVPFGDPRVAVLGLAEAVRRMPDRVAALHGRLVPLGTDRFADLATAFQNCGAYVEIPDGVVLEEPLPLAWIARAGHAQVVFSHTVIRLGRGARATIVERHAGETEAFVAGIVEAELAPGAELDYVVDQRADGGSRVFLRRVARVGQAAAVRWHLAELGGAYVRSHASAELTGARATARTQAFAFARGFANLDLTVLADHLAAATASRTVVRCAAADRAAIRFTGDVRVARAVAGADAALRADGLLLSRDAALDLTPGLEIASGRVAATHAVTIGSLDENRLFYAQTRGIARAAAERMMALAFFEPAICGFPGEPLRDEMRGALEAGLDEVHDTFAV